MRPLALGLVLLQVARALECTHPGKPTTVALSWLDSQSAINVCNSLCFSPCSPSPTPLPPCDGAALLDSYGCWANSSDVTPAQLSNHMRGDAAYVLSTWRRVWLPRTCSYTRHAGASFPSTCPRLRTLLSRDSKELLPLSEVGPPPPRVAWWLLILGDSGSGRGLYCHLYALLVAGTERVPRDSVYQDAENPAEQVGCGGLVANSDKLSYPHGIYEWNETHKLQFAASKESTSRVFSFVAPEVKGGRRLRVSWAYTEGLGDGIGTLRTAWANALNSTWAGGPRAPDDVVLGSGIYDYRDMSWSDAQNVWAADAEKMELNLRVAEERRAGVVSLMELIDNSTRGGLGAASSSAAEAFFRRNEAQAGAGAAAAAAAEANRSRVRFWARNNHCQSRFPAVHADVRVEPAVRERGGGILETLNFSVNHWQEGDMSIDGYHYDNEPWQNQEVWSRPERVHVGELNSQAAQSALGQLCRE